MINRLYHQIEPIYDKYSKILILGSFPSVKSRENQFFYGNPMNRFWKVISKITNNDIVITIEDKKHLLLQNRIALWDIVKSCTVIGSSDSSIKDVVPNDLNKILQIANIKQIFCNGNKSYELFKKYCEKQIGMCAIKLPSTSPANANFNVDKLVTEWSIIKNFL